MRALLLLLAGCTSEIAPRYVHLTDQPSYISGSVVDAEGHAAGPVVLTDGRMTWDHEGRFSFPVVPGDYKLRAFGEQSEGDLQISVEPGEELHGLVLDLHPDAPDPPIVDDDADENENADEDDMARDEPRDRWTPAERPVVVRNLDDEGRPLVATWMEVRTATPHEGWCRSSTGSDQTDLDGEIRLRLPDSWTLVDLEIPGYLTDPLRVEPEQNQLTVHHRRGVELRATIRDAPDGIEIHCGPSVKFLDEDQRVRITCPAGLSRVEIESDPPRAFSLSGEPGQTLYGIIQL